MQWEAGSLPGKQAAEFNAALRVLWRARATGVSDGAAPLLRLVNKAPPGESATSAAFVHRGG
jgi:hypothetical protein